MSETELRAENERLRRQVEVLLAACKGCVSAMRMQEKRETEEFHLSAQAFWPIWDGAAKQAEEVSIAIEGGAT